MDAESGELFHGGGVAVDSWQIDSPFSCSDLIFGSSKKPLRDWVVNPECVSVSLCASVCGWTR